MINLTVGFFIKRHSDGTLRKDSVVTTADVDKAMFEMIEQPPARRKRSDDRVQNQNLDNQHKTDSLDLIFHPEKAEKRRQDMRAARQLSRPVDRQTCQLD